MRVVSASLSFVVICAILFGLPGGPVACAADSDGPLINEFMASSGSTAPLGAGEILDEDGDSSDWIEIHNPGGQSVDMSGWYLTDDADDLTKWRFPDGTQLGRGGFMLVFASGKDHADEELHTNFKLSDDGEYLGLVQSDGRTVVHEYAPRYPEQFSDVSYGLGPHGGTFVTPGTLASYHVPGPADASAAWTAPTYNDSAWPTGESGLGFSPTGQLSNRDIGSVTTPGSYFTQEGTYVVQGDGTGISGSRDGFHFVYMPLRGDGELTVNVSGMITANEWAEVGVMVRESLASNSRYGAAMLSYGHGVVFQARTSTSGTSTTKQSNNHGVPLRLRVIRRGDTISGYYSLDGVTWTQQGAETVAMGPDVYIGLCVTSHSAGTPCTGVFNDVTFGSDENNALRDAMVGTSATLWTRFEFDAGETASFDSLRLRMRYEDGFVAFLNGAEVARANFTGTLQWDSVADSDRSDQSAVDVVEYDLSDQKDLLRDGRNVLAVAVLNDDKDDETLFVSPELVATGEVLVPQYFSIATPGRANATEALDLVAAPQFSHPRGLCDAPFTLTLSCDTPGALIRYTTDGTAPTQTSGIAYTGPITIDGTTCIRAGAFRAGWMASGVQTYSYLFFNDILEQPKAPAGFPSSWNGTTADYEMDPDVVDAREYRDLARASLLTLPTLSVVTTVDNIFGPSGVYSNPWGEGVGWERPVSVEWIRPDGTTGFQVDAGIRVYGGAFRGFNLTRKKSFRLLFKRQYGPTKLDFDVFEGQDAVTSFDMLVLRAGANDGWNDWGRQSTQYIVDEYMRRTQLAMGEPSPHGTFVHLYLNGLYWGLYNLTERPVAPFCANYFDGEKEDWDAVNAGSAAGDSSTATWNAMLSQARSGLTDTASYQQIQGNNPDGTDNPDYDDLLDVDNYITYMLCNFWGGTGDWPGHNYYAACRKPPNSTGFKFFNWDAEGAIVIWSSLNANVTGVSDGAGQPYAALRDNREFLLRFGDHVQKQMFDGGPLTSEASYARYKELADEVELAIIAESARWGDQSSSTPYTLAHWQSTRDSILNNYMPRRPDIVLDQLRNAGLYPSVDPPTFGIGADPQHGGYVALNQQLWMHAPEGTVYYTTDGTDPRAPAGTSASDTLVTLLTEDAPKRVLVPTEANGGDQLGNTPAAFSVTYYKASDTVSSLAIAEQVVSGSRQRLATAAEQATVINYFNTGTPGHFDNDRPFPGTQMNADVDNFVVLVTGKVLIPSAGEWTFGVNSDDGFGLTLTRGTRTYSMSNPSPRSPSDTLEVFNIVQAGQYDLRLVYYEQGGGAELELFASPGRRTSFSETHFRLVGDITHGGLLVGEGNVWFTDAFDDSSWTAGTGGVGYEAGSGSYPNYFDIDVQSEMYNGNTSCYIRIPFTVDDAEYSNMMLRIRYDDGFVAYLNGAEVARRNFTGDPAWNSTASSGNSDNAAVTLASVDISAYAGLLRQGTNLLAIHGLNLSAGSSDFLISAELVAGEISQGTVSPTAIPYTALIPLTGSTHVKARTFAGQWSALNEATFAVGPVAENLRISEIMYHPADPNAEYIELTNVGAETINLNLATLSRGVDFTFGDVSIAPGGCLLVVEDIAAFEAVYGPGLPIAGQYEGSLDNGGERIELQDAAGYTIHKFSFADGWYDVTDGMGFSLTVKDPAGIDPNALGQKGSWRPSAYEGGSPGFDDSGDVVELGAIVINELMSDGQKGQPDWIELYNTTDEAINIGGWFVSDDVDDLVKYEIAEGTVIGPDGYLMLYEDEHFGNASDPGCHVPFALSRNGETVYLHSGSDGVLTGYSVQESFGPAEEGVSFGRYTKSTGASNFVAMSEPTPGRANAAPKVGPVVISEIMYNPPDSIDVEYVELLNISGAPVTLYDADRAAPWRFTDNPDNPGIELFFPTAQPVMMAPGECIVLTQDSVAFNDAYIVPAGTQVFEWLEGKLANGSEKIQLSAPGETDEDGTRHWIRIDRVVYSDGFHPEDFETGVDPWPQAADGFGGSLTRIDPAAYGNDPVNWQAAAPTPGLIN